MIVYFLLGIIVGLLSSGAIVCFAVADLLRRRGF